MKLIRQSAMILGALVVAINVQATNTSTASAGVNQNVMSAEEAKAGAEQGKYCLAKNNLSYSRGAVIEENKKLYRCVKNYGNNFDENTKLVWVELTMKNGEAVTAD